MAEQPFEGFETILVDNVARGSKRSRYRTLNSSEGIRTATQLV
jgi:hypothetical protein